MIKLLRKNIFSIFRHYPKKIDLSSTSGTFRVCLLINSLLKWRGSIANNCWLCLTTIILNLCLLENTIPTIWFMSTGAPKQDGKIRDLSPSETCSSVLSSPDSTMVSSVTREPRPTKTTRDKSECLGLNATLLGSKNQQRELPCQTSTGENCLTSFKN